MAGRKPELSNVHYLPGSTQATSEQIAMTAKLKPVLPKAAGIVWDRLAPELMVLNRLKPHYVDAFGEYCYLLARIAEMRKMLADEGETYKIIGRNGAQIKSRPEVAQLNDDWRKLSRLTSCFGLTPSDEKSLITSIQNNLVDEFAEFS
ncbi:P27 family phage terminase small subunit [Methylobacter sp. S3L5C]|uniref:P27 family phage terminase small subunit n=1 Tax=Methylobacter sp. S3L5C TaxID=2839024 RepID=UPI001FAB67E8|nr:P27 family phage terminase small subunit [Methylobacter sp. S3L5C]UOA08337.1 P27 family phage terminase small subunit [Methylobacter sp. S3L5C]